MENLRTLPPVPHGSKGYAAYEPSGGVQNPAPFSFPVFCLWYVYDPEPGPYPPGKETNIAFLLGDVFGFLLDWWSTLKWVIPYTMSQVTPPLSSIQASGKGDGLDFAWVDLTDTVLNK